MKIILAPFVLLALWILGIGALIFTDASQAEIDYELRKNWNRYLNS